LMPVADFTGTFGWGYDGVNLFAPTRLYGEPDDFRRFVKQAHLAGLGVILDVVYNHFGPDGNYLPEFSPDYFTDRYKNDWGEPINFDGKASEAVREFYVANAAYWIREFHLDGLRLDATQQIFDATKPNIMTLITAAVREAAGVRKTFIVAENEPQDVRLIRQPAKGGHGIDALWNDDFHHAAVVAMTGRNEAYYTDYHGSAQEFVSAAKWGFLYQGQRYKWQRARRGTPSLDFEPENFVNYLQNHDQVANSLWGHRIHTLTSAGRLRALTALLLLGPNTPMLFQGQEFAASSPFLYFADHPPELAEVVRKGRAEFLKQFPSIASSDTTKLVANPGNRETFERCKLDFADRERNAAILRLHGDLIRLRRNDPFLGTAPRGTYDGAVLSNSAFVLRFFGRAQDDRLLVVNLGERIHLDPAPEPLLAPPLDCEWVIHWSSEDPRYGGSGTPPLDSEENWNIPAEAAVLLIPGPRKR
ncbi:MAG TPA: alpha-amylase family glycosyl hydrolase, partial [Chthoniobacteraceae bacterium]|nr:alpha-amylase family glycosyl hydrolase [Chthoniobacteraceae bacterium]